MKNQNPYISNRFTPMRRISIPVKVGNSVIGGGAPILIQSMTNTPTSDIHATVSQTIKLAQAGCKLIRYTVPTVKDALCLKEITSELKKKKCAVPLCADIHFQPKAAYESLKWVNKVRINPGNFSDKKIRDIKSFSDSDFDNGVQKVFETFAPFVRAASAYGTSLRIGTNHGSLSDRILYKYGNTPEGMVESALEYLRVCEAENFDQLVFSMKASNPRVTIYAYRLLASRLQQEHKNYPFHLGVTEAGAGADGRLKSSVGIGSLLLDGIGDTIRVSLTEDPVKEIPAAKELIKSCGLYKQEIHASDSTEEDVNFYAYKRRRSAVISLGNVTIGGTNPVPVGIHLTTSNKNISGKPEWITVSSIGKCRTDVPFFLQAGKKLKTFPNGCPITIPSSYLADLTAPLPDICELLIENLDDLDKIKIPKLISKKIFWSVKPQGNIAGKYRFLAAWLRSRKNTDPIILRCSLRGDSGGISAAAVMGSLLADGIGDMIHISGKGGTAASNLAFDILQAAGARRTKTEYISCPGCGRTLFNLEKTLSEIKKTTSHLKDVSIGVMGCIVNGPGEMADADFGYVGGKAGKIHLYVGQSCVKKNIDPAKAPEILIELIKKHGKWIKPGDLSP